MLSSVYIYSHCVKTVCFQNVFVTGNNTVDVYSAAVNVCQLCGELFNISTITVNCSSRPQFLLNIINRKYSLVPVLHLYFSYSLCVHVFGF